MHFSFYEYNPGGIFNLIPIAKVTKPAEKLTGAGNTVARYKSVWQYTLPSNLKARTLYLTYADVSNGCELNAGAVRAATTQRQGFFGQIAGFFTTLFGGEAPTPSPAIVQDQFEEQNVSANAIPTSTAKQSLQLEPFYPGSFVVKECNYTYFNFDKI